MEGRKVAKQKSWIVLPFLVGFVGVLILGWWVFPKVLYSEKSQPISFSHKVHVEDEMMDCFECHDYREDGSYAGFPTTYDCAGCHMDVLGDDPAEEKFVEEYVYPDKEVPWKVYQKQPDNVYFSHIAHEDFDCTECHPDVGQSDSPPKYRENRLTGYSEDTMKMWKCERCHAQNGVSNACYICHK
ncbi:MAG: menaquinone reductase multiheme cytochrome c subunit QrcA [Desulfonatronovibrionaceae bacterium]